MPPSRRDDLVTTAMQVFCEHGFHASGLERVLEAGDISRMTLYNHFKSKDELIVAALRRKDQIVREQLAEFVERSSRQPRERVLSVFDFLEAWCTSKGFTGCMFVNASAEFSDAASMPRQIAAEHKQSVARLLRDLCRDCGLVDPEGVAEQLQIVFEGAITMARVVGQVRVQGASGSAGADLGAPARTAKTMAAAILNAAPTRESAPAGA